MTPGQFGDLRRRSEPTFTAEQRLYAAILERTWVDYCEIVLNGRPDLDQHDEFGEQDCRDISDFVFSDSHGAGDPNLLSCRAICRELRLELAEVRDRFRKICPPEEFVAKLAPKGAPRTRFARHEREQSRRRRVAVLTVGE